MEIKYFELGYEDISQISEMEREYFGQPWSESSIATYAEKGNTIFVVARDGVKVAGYAAVMCVLDEGNLVSIAVGEKYRNMGIARELLDIAYDMAHERGVTSINLEVRQSNVPAITLYESEGFNKVGQRRDFYSNPKEDALIYIKDL